MYKINETDVAKRDLLPRLTDIYANRAERVMFVRGDDELNFAYIAEVIDIGRAANVDHIGLMTPKIRPATNRTRSCMAGGNRSWGGGEAPVCPVGSQPRPEAVHPAGRQEYNFFILVSAPPPAASCLQFPGARRIGTT